MKKILAVVMSLALLLCPAALAQSAEELAPAHEHDEFDDAELAGYEAELDEFWAKADPIYEQIQQLGDRQSEIYEEANIPLDSGDDGFMTTEEYGDYLRGLNALSEEEIARILDVNERADALYTQAETLDEDEDADQIQSLYDQADVLFDSIADLEERLRTAEEIFYVDSLTGLSDETRAELKDMYETQRDLEEELSALEAQLSEGALHILYSDTDL